MSAASLNSRAERLYTQLVAAANWLQSPLLLLLRLYWGWQFFMTGKGKLLNLGRTSEFFQSLNIPFPSSSAALTGVTECLGGLLLLVGLATRLACLPLIVVLVTAYATAEHEALAAIFSDPDKFLSATPFQFLLACLIVLAFGPGAFSVDALIARKRNPQREPRLP